MNTRTTVRNEKNEQAPATAPSEADASNSLKNRTSASDERPPLMASLPAQQEASDERHADCSREDDPDVAARPASQQGGQRRRNKDYDDEEEEEIEQTEELRHGTHSLFKLIKNVTLCMVVVTASMPAKTSFGTGPQVYLVFTPFHEKGKKSSGQKLGETHLRLRYLRYPLARFIACATGVYGCYVRVHPSDFHPVFAAMDWLGAARFHQRL